MSLKAKRLIFGAIFALILALVVGGALSVESVRALRGDLLTRQEAFLTAMRKRDRAELQALLASSIRVDVPLWHVETSRDDVVANICTKPDIDILSQKDVRFSANLSGLFVKSTVRERITDIDVPAAERESEYEIGFTLENGNWLISRISIEPRS